MTTYVGFEIEVEDDKHYYDKYDRPIYKLLDSSYPITELETFDGIRGYHEDYHKSSQGKWRIEQDDSLQYGAEFIMPPLEKDIGLKILEDFFLLIEASGCITSNRCGLHLNISGNKQTLDDINIGYFLSNMNFRLLSKLWPLRVNNYNSYCTGISKILKNIAESKNRRQEHPSIHRNINITSELLQKQLLNGHNYMVNMRVDEDTNKRFEIRAMGGENYHKEIEKIKTTTNMFANLLEKSTNIEPKHINRRIVSYINRVNKKQDNSNNVWMPTRGCRGVTPESLINNLNSIENIHKQDLVSFCRKLTNCYAYSEYRKQTSATLSQNYEKFDKYCNIMLSIVSTSLTLYTKESDIPKITGLANAAIYYIIKYIDYNTNNADRLSIPLIKNYMTKKYSICDMQIKLTIPDKEQQKDIIWLSKYMYLFDMEIRQSYVDRLSNPTLKFINRYKKKHGKRITRMIQKKIKAAGE